MKLTNALKPIKDEKPSPLMYLWNYLTNRCENQWHQRKNRRKELWYE